MTEADAVMDPDSDEEAAGERKDSLDVQEEGKTLKRFQPKHNLVQRLCNSAKM